MIHWFYHRHEDNKRVDVRESVYSFLNKVLMHCPEKNFKMVRYYGFYSNKSECEPVRVNTKIKFALFFLYSSNQSGLIWHSHNPYFFWF